MSLSETYRDLQVDPYSYCKTCNWYDSLDDKDRAFFDDKARNTRDSIRKLWRACRDNGMQVSETAFRRHVQDHVRRGRA